MVMHWLGSVRPHPGIAPTHPRTIQSHPYESMAYLTPGGLPSTLPMHSNPSMLVLEKISVSPYNSLYFSSDSRSLF